VGIGGSILDIIGVEGIEDGANDGDVGWVGAGFGVVFVAEGFEESSE
jgi:hypothetical protein